MTRPPAIELAPGVFRIPTIGKAAVNSFAFVDGDGSVTLVDCGVAKAPARIVAGLAAIGKHPADVTRIVLTHVHSDHAGGAAEMAQRTGAPVLTHAADAEFAEAGRLPKADSSFLSGRIFNRVNRGKFAKFAVASPLADGDLLDVGGGLRVLHTPGHSPGHVSLLHEPTKLLITGDAIFNFLGLRWPMRFICSDFLMTQATAQVLGEVDYDLVAFTHGEEIREQAREKVRGFLSRPA
ncbi:putative metallo-beta-lactamase superfamily protein [Rhizocola hellebori]|uniref:Putative metallo-beta-lactamase superfamily protein n=1 Tax=Rhizocola hellebori TaxID=1392758 RepID=A0A8J3Q6G7_9ACTN|nr:MBL fold metallo-hydrolase [Rhizocola hellebori]GIH04829.1 putative metallo-beta-lactamase superfamily protein [Rhizocola hellebori]